jgi:hypothetical protein
VLVTNKCVKTAGGRDDDVRVSVLVLENLGIFCDGSSTVEDCRLDIRHILAESSIFVFDLVCELASMAHNENRGLSSDGLNLLKSGEDEDSCFTKTGFGLAEDIGTKDSLGNANLLDCRVNRAMSDKFQVYNRQMQVLQRPSIIAV